MIGRKRLLMLSEARFGFLLLLLAVACAIPYFLDLGYLTIRMWDESRLAVNVIEMHVKKSPLVPLYDGSPDMWNTKPPLLLWLQLLSMKIFGFNEFAFRIPSAIAALLTSLTLFVFSAKVMKNYLAGSLAAVLLFSMHGNLGEHVARTRRL